MCWSPTACWVAPSAGWIPISASRQGWLLLLDAARWWCGSRGPHKRLDHGCQYELPSLVCNKKVKRKIKDKVLIHVKQVPLPGPIQLEPTVGYLLKATPCSQRKYLIFYLFKIFHPVNLVGYSNDSWKIGNVLQWELNYDAGESFLC